MCLERCCGIVGILLKLYCKSGCRAGAVASALAFHPPSPPVYELRKREQRSDQKAGASFQLVRNHPDLPVVDTTVSPEVHLVGVAGNRSRIVVSVYRKANADLTLIHSHGNAADIGIMHERYKLLSTVLGCNVVGYDYTGYGHSTGTPEERKTYKDIEAVLRFVQDIGLVSDVAKQVILYGQSIGSGPSVWLASQVRVLAMILHSPIASGLRVITSSRLLCCCDIFPNLERIRKVKRPVFVIHGSDDEEVDVTNGIRLFNNLPQRETAQSWWVPRAGHNDIVQLNFEEYVENIKSFVTFAKQGGSMGAV